MQVSTLCICKEASYSGLDVAFLPDFDLVKESCSMMCWLMLSQSPQLAEAAVPYGAAEVPRRACPALFLRASALASFARRDSLSNGDVTAL